MILRIIRVICIHSFTGKPLKSSIDCGESRLSQRLWLGAHHLLRLAAVQHQLHRLDGIEQVQPTIMLLKIAYLIIIL
jgi:hypothetical protein